MPGRSSRIPIIYLHRASVVELLVHFDFHLTISRSLSRSHGDKFTYMIATAYEVHVPNLSSSTHIRLFRNSQVGLACSQDARTYLLLPELVLVETGRGRRRALYNTSMAEKEHVSNGSTYCSVTMTSRSCSVWSTWVHMGTMQETPVGSVFEGLVEGVCIILIFALRRKSAEPPRPLSILDPTTQVLFACACLIISIHLRSEIDYPQPDRLT